MYKKALMAVLLFTTALYVTACGKETETTADMPAGSSSAETLSDETKTQNPTEEKSLSAEETEDSGQASRQAGEAEEETSCSYIFSDTPVAAYEVTGLGIGRFESVYEGDDEISYPLVRLTPGENTFILFCMQGDENGEYSVSTSTIHSPSGSSQWEAVTYTCLDALIDPVPESYSILTRQETDNYSYGEGTYGGSFFSLVDPWWEWLRFAEIYHPDAPQDDTIYAIDLATFSDMEEYDEMDEVLAGLVNGFDVLGGTLKEIPVEEALEKCNIEVSQ